MFCTNCGKQLDDSFDFCPECGAAIVKTDSLVAISNNLGVKQCPKCGADMPLDALYCFSCGTAFDEFHTDIYTDINQLNQRIQPHRYGVWRNKWIALALCIFLGWIGAHKFYEKKIVMGFLYVFTFGIFCIGWAVDIIRLIFKPNPYMAKG